MTKSHAGLALLLLFALHFPTGVGAQPFEWPRATPGEVNIDPAMITTLVQRISNGDYGRQKSLLILRHGKLVHEQYFNGHSASEEMPMYSATKSWSSALVGIALRQGDLPPIETTIDKIFTDYPQVFAQNLQKRNITFRDLLTMRHGLAWDEWSTSFTNPSNPVRQMTQSPDWWNYVLSRQNTAAPDTVFRYSTGVSNLMGAAIYNQTRMSAIEYFEQYLFEPMDIDQYHVEVDLSDGPRGSGIVQFQTGLTPTGHGLWLKATDMAKLGQLYLDHGAWKARRLMDSEWIQESWQEYSNHVSDPETFGEGVSYGYQWWNFDLPSIKNGVVPVHLAWGYADQFIFVIPSLDMVIVTTADNGSWNGATMRTAVREIVLEGVGSDFDPISDGGLTGSWITVHGADQGFMMEVVPSTGQVVMYWMTYDPNSGAQQWTISVGQLHGRRAMLELLRPEGGQFEKLALAQIKTWGDAEILFHTCTTATMTFFSEVSQVAGVVDLRRLTPVSTCVDQ